MSMNANSQFKKSNASSKALMVLSFGALCFPNIASAQSVSELPELSPMESAQSADININDVLQEIDQAIPSGVVETIETTEVPAPTTQLMDPQDANTRAAIEQVISIPDIPALEVDNKPDDNLFFDAEALVPRGEVAKKGAPRKVSPATEPGSKLIVVKKNYGANSKKAEMIAAERAMKLGRYSAALEMYEAMYAKNKRDPNVLMGRAEAYQRLGDDDFAVQAYEELLNIRPKNVEARVNMLGIISEKYPSVALRQLMDLRKKNNGHVGIVAQIAVAQANLEQYQDAINYLGIAASMEPKNPSHVFNMAVVADKAGEKKKAIEFYEEALEIDTLYGKGEAIPRAAVFERLASLR